MHFAETITFSGGSILYQFEGESSFMDAAEFAELAVTARNVRNAFLRGSDLRIITEFKNKNQTPPEIPPVLQNNLNFTDSETMELMSNGHRSRIGYD